MAERLRKVNVPINNVRKLRTQYSNTKSEKNYSFVKRFLTIIRLGLRSLEPFRNNHFVTLMNSFMPQWKPRRFMLNRLPLRHDGGT
jgi:hypothetical protein